MFLRWGRSSRDIDAPFVPFGTFRDSICPKVLVGPVDIPVEMVKTKAKYPLVTSELLVTVSVPELKSRVIKPLGLLRRQDIIHPPLRPWHCAKEVLYDP